MSASRRPPVAYEDAAFLDGDEGRPVRILAEYLEPLQRLRLADVRDAVVFFGSARLRREHPLGHYLDEARELARTLTTWSLTLPEDRSLYVCTGGGGGIMEAANRGAAEAGGRSIGLNIGLPREQIPNVFVTPELSFEFHYFFMRKFWFAHLAQATGKHHEAAGTLDELTEILTLLQTGKLPGRMPVILYGSSYWKDILNLDGLARQGMIASSDLALFHYADTPQEALALLQSRIAFAPVPPVPGST